MLGQLEECLQVSGQAVSGSDPVEFFDVMSFYREHGGAVSMPLRLAEFIGVLRRVIELMLDDGAERSVVEVFKPWRVERDDEVGNGPEPLLELLFAAAFLPRALGPAFGIFRCCEDYALLFPVRLVGPEHAQTRGFEMRVIRVVERTRAIDERVSDPPLDLARPDETIDLAVVYALWRHWPRVCQVPLADATNRAVEG